MHMASMQYSFLAPVSLQWSIPSNRWWFRDPSQRDWRDWSWRWVLQQCVVCAWSSWKPNLCISNDTHCYIQESNIYSKLCGDLRVSTVQVVAVGFADHDLRMYKFSHFLPYSQGNALLSHANETTKLWHERYGHFNYRYLQSLSKEKMMEGLPSIKFSNGTCKGCIVGKPRIAGLASLH